jgi:hypothetical protein
MTSILQQVGSAHTKDQTLPSIYCEANNHQFFARVLPPSIMGLIKPTTISEKASPFLRDSRVVLPSGTHLIPFSVEDINPDSEFPALLPQSAAHFLVDENAPSNDGFTGKGYLKRNTSQARRTATKLKITFENATTCIEGGNCIHFKLKDEPAALVGELSLSLSMMALMQQGELQQIIDELPDEFSEDTPSLYAYQTSRNLHRFRKYTEIDDPTVKDQFDYFNDLAAPLTPNDLITYHRGATQIQAELNFTKKRMAEELKVPLKNLIIIPQTTFHIDMELFVTPEGQVGLHDDAQTLKILKRLPPAERNQAETHLINGFTQNATRNRDKFTEIRKKRIQILKDRGVPFVHIPGIFKSTPYGSKVRSTDVELNYCNGVFSPPDKSCNKTTFFTTGPTFGKELEIHSLALSKLQGQFPHVRFVCITTLSEIVAKRFGGFHCLTFERFPDLLDSNTKNENGVDL